MAAKVAEAEQALRAADTPEANRQAKAVLHIAKYKQADVSKAMRQIEMETSGRFTLGEPMATEFRTREEIAAQNIIGVYREGAGDGA